MNWFKNFKTATKLIAGFGTLVVLLGLIIVISLGALSEMRDSQRKLFENDFTIVESLIQLRANLNRERADIERMLLTTNRTEQVSMEGDIMDRTGESEAIMQRLLAFYRNDADFLRRLEQLQTVRNEYKRTRETQTELIRDGKPDEAKRLSVGLQSDRYEKLRSMEMELATDAKQRAKAAVAASEQRARDSMGFFMLIGIVAIGAAATMTFMLNRLISRPLGEMALASQRIASGDLTVKLSIESRVDEIGLLAKTFGDMSENLREQIRGLIESTSVLVPAASQILESTSQLASTAAESAAAVSQTTTTVEEVRQTSQVSCEKAKLVSETAHRATQTSQQGRQSTDEVAEGMNRIREQMEAIAESMVRLSEQSQAIGQIIAAVEDVAAQSNLLAVNASIEAAKAGEHGTGFRVVAQEVRILAEQSKEATRQVRNILNDIQKATTAAVMATERGSNAVEAGAKQTKAAGESIQLMAGSISEAAQAAIQIAASSQQQLAGMDQVAMAMENIKEVTGQNVTSAKQLESSARSINELGQRLKRLIERYRI